MVETQLVLTPHSEITKTSGQDLMRPIKDRLAGRAVLPVLSPTLVL